MSSIGWTARRLLLLLAILSVLCGCAGSSRLGAYRADAVSSGNLPLALAADDARVTANGYDTGRDEARRDRALDFDRLVDRELAGLTPITAENAEKSFHRLAALVEHARMEPADRADDLRPVVEAKLLPPLRDAAEQMWPRVEADAARGALSDALLLGSSIVRLVPDGGGHTARFEEIRAKARESFEAVGKQASSEQAGAAILYARLAREAGAKPADEPAAKQLSEFASLKFEVTARAGCGGLAERVARRLNTNGPGTPATVTLDFGTCTITPREWSSRETGRYDKQVKAIRKVKVSRYERVCRNVDTSSGLSAPVLVNRNKETGAAMNCGYETVEHLEDAEVDEVQSFTEAYEVRHRSAKAQAAGRVRIAWAGGEREVPFDLTGLSKEDLQYSSENVGSRSFSKDVEDEAASALRDGLLEALEEAQAQAQAARAERFLAQAQAAASSGAMLDAEHAFFVASQLTGKPDPAFEKWMAEKRQVAAPVLAAAVADRDMPAMDAGTFLLPAVEPKVVLEEVAWVRRVREIHKEQEERTTMLLTFGLGPSRMNRPAETGVVLYGGALSLGSTVMIPEDGWVAGSAVRVNFSIDQLAAPYVDGDLLLGAGLRLGGFTLGPLAGGGVNSTPGLDSIESPDPRPLLIPTSAYFEYGARTGYAFGVVPLTLEVIFAKTIRYSDVFPAERRADFRLATRLFDTGLSLSMRYSEQAAATDAFTTVFTPKDRIAQTLWALGGITFF